MSTRLILAGLTVALVTSFAGCAARSKAERAEKAAAKTRIAGVWPVKEYADYQTDDVDLKIDDRVHTVSIPALRTYAAVADDIASIVKTLQPADEDRTLFNVTPLFLVIEGESPNAMATYRHGHPVVAVNLAMIAMLGDDASMWAQLIGHEMAHLQLDHLARRQERQAPTDATKGALAIALAVVGVPFALLATDTALTAVDRRYSRDDERAADALAVKYMQRAGYDVSGALRFQEKMAAVSKNRADQFFSTHPTWDERIERLRTLIAPERR